MIKGAMGHLAIQRQIYQSTQHINMSIPHSPIMLLLQFSMTPILLGAKNTPIRHKAHSGTSGSVLEENNDFGEVE